MKKLIKLAVSMLVCGAVLITGCGKTSAPSLPDELKAPNTDYPNTINIIAPEFFAGLSADDTEIKQQWLDEMSQRYGVNLNIISNFYTDSGDFDNSAGEKAQDVLAGNDTTFKGLMRIFGSSMDSSVRVGIEYDTIVPLEDYLADNAVWNSLPESFKSLFEVDGHIYAIPTHNSRTQSARVIHDEALQDTGITVTDLDSFRDFAVSYAKDTGNATISCVNVTEMTDILNAFGLYPGENFVNQFCYDPTEDCYVDWLTKGAALDALEYLRSLYNAGAIYLSYIEDSTKFDSGKISSNYRRYADYDNCTEVLTLNPEYPQFTSTLTSGFAMTKDTPQPKETINFLVNMLYGSEQNYLDCWLGSSDNYILNSDGTITVEMAQDSRGNYIYPGMPNLTGGLSDIFPYSDASIYYSQNGVVDMETKTDAGKYNACLKLLYESLRNKSVVEIPLLFKNIRSVTYGANRKAVGKLYQACFQDAIVSKDKTVQQIVDEYKAAMLNLGGNQMLDEMNAAIGKQTVYYYD